MVEYHSLFHRCSSSFQIAEHYLRPRQAQPRPQMVRHVAYSILEIAQRIIQFSFLQIDERYHRPGATDLGALLECRLQMRARVRRGMLLQCDGTENQMSKYIIGGSRE